MECIICQDTGSEPVQDNTTCSCKYKRHSSCWIDYVHSRDKVICPLCRKDLTIKETPKTKSTIHTPLRQSIPIASTPYAPQLRTIPEETGQQITYQEFVNTVQQYNSTHTTIEVRPSIQPPQPLPKKATRGEQIAKIIIIGAIIIAVIIFIIVFA